MKRKQPTPREVLRIVMQQVVVSNDGHVTLICPVCWLPIWEADWPKVIREHLHALGLGGEDTPANQAFVHPGCAQRKTDGRAGESKLSISGNGDKSKIAKVKRIWRREVCREQVDSSAVQCKRRIQSRGFDKTLRKRMDGTVERRAVK